MNSTRAANAGRSVSHSLQFRRIRLYRVLALLALALAVFVFVNPLIPGLDEDTSLQIPSLSGAVGLLAALVLLRALCMSSVIVQYYLLMVPVVGLMLFAVSEFVAPQLATSGSVIAALAALYAFLYEQGLMVEISQTGFFRVSRYPMPRRVLVGWDEIETVTADLRVITTRFVGESYGITDQKNRLVVRGTGKKSYSGPLPIGGLPGLMSMIRDG